MSVRPIEVQGSFPQSQKAGKIQEQLQQRSQTGQDILAQQHKESEQNKRMRVGESKETEQSRFHKDGEGQKDGEAKKDRQQSELEEKRQAKHPYKGQFIDLMR